MRYVFFFFQAEDGIRDGRVTGVQTCALPIYREFLNQLVGGIVEIAHSKLVRYRGDWDSYIEQKAAREEQQLAAYKNQQKEIASLQLFADRFRAKASKASQAQSKLKQIDRMKKIAARSRAERRSNSIFPNLCAAVCA